MDLSQKIDVVDSQRILFSFEKRFLYTQTPVIIKGLLKHTPAENA
jgi:hypothetical protein